MKNFGINKTAVLVNLVLGFVFGIMLQPSMGAAAYAVSYGAITMAQVAYYHTPTGVTFAGITPEVWVRDIAENIYPNSEFYLQSRDDSEFLEGDTLHLPQSGSRPGVEKNRAVVPAPVSQRDDTEKSYVIHEFTTDPVLLKRTEEIEVSYNKRQSLLFDHLETLRQEIAEMFLTEWGPSLATNFVRTSGNSRTAKKAGQTGNRKKVAKDDLIRLDEIMNQMDVPQDNRKLLVDAHLKSDIMGIDEFVSFEKIGKAKLETGVIGQIMNFDVMVRSSVLRYNNAGTPVIRPQGSTVDTDDNLAALAWHPSFVRRCLGSEGNQGIEVFSNEKQAQYYGDIFSALVRAGGTKARTDQKGLAALIEDTP